MASIKKIINKRGIEKYQVSVRIRGFAPLFHTAPTYEGAEKFGKLAERKIRKEQVALLNPHSWLPPSGDFLDERLKETVKHFMRARPNNWLKATLPALIAVMGDPTIRQLTPSWIERYIARARKAKTLRGVGYSWTSISHQLCAVSKVLQWRAGELDVLAPTFSVKKKHYEMALEAEGLDRTALDNQRDRRLGPDEEKRLLEVLLAIEGPRKNHWPLMQRLALETGARLQELVRAEWSEIDPSFEWWTIPKHHSKTKTERTVVLTDEAVEIVRELKWLENPASPRIFHPMGTPKSASSEFRKMRIKAGLVDYRFHDNRHEGLTRFVISQPQIPIKAVMQMAGHSDLDMLNRYVKFRPHELASMIRRQPKAA